MIEENDRARKLYEVVCGSQLYGLVTPESDVDFGHVYADSKKQLFGFSPTHPKLKQTTTKSKDDNRHWLRQFANLCQKGNPNAIEWLWASNDSIMFIHPLFKKHILDNADAFIGLNGLSNSHFGFATSQIKKMKDATGKVGKKRRECVKIHGYDTRFAHHAIRLMFQLMELVQTGKVIYPIPHGESRDLLMRIKTGGMPEKELVELFNSMRQECNIKIEANLAGIPLNSDTTRVNKLLIEFFEEFYYG